MSVAHATPRQKCCHFTAVMPRQKCCSFAGMPRVRCSRAKAKVCPSSTAVPWQSDVCARRKDPSFERLPLITFRPSRALYSPPHYQAHFYFSVRTPLSPSIPSSTTNGQAFPFTRATLQFPAVIGFPPHSPLITPTSWPALLTSPSLFLPLPHCSVP